MSKTRDYLQRKAAARIPTPVLDAAGKAVLKGVDKAVEERWAAARIRAAGAKGDTLDAQIKSVGRSFNRELTSLGAATGAAAATPGLGTAGAVSMLAAEVGWFAFRATDLIMTIGALHGHLDSSAEERRAWVLAILAFGEEAADEFASLAGELDGSLTVGGERVGALMAGVAGGDAATLDALRRINATLASKVLTKYGSRKGLVTIGKLLPFGIGAVVGGSANWLLGRTVAAQSGRFFADYDSFVDQAPPRPAAAALPAPPPALPAPPQPPRPPQPPPPSSPAEGSR